MPLVDDVVVIIPAYNPDKKFVEFVSGLSSYGYKHILAVNDGSRDDTLNYFMEAEVRFGVKILSHSINLGQGRAYKTGFNYYLSKAKTGCEYAGTIGVIQCDCDGQHCVEYINRCADLLRKNSNSLILGVRDFSGKNVPFRSRFGNECTNLVFRIFCGIDIRDTQTGLKGIPISFIPALMETPGERFEYASSILLETKKQGMEILQFPIRTIYINGNETSHFNPLTDSVRIYSLILKYMFSSFSAFVVDIAIFSIFLRITYGWLPKSYIIVSAYAAKIFSCTYSFFINKNFVFRSRAKGISAKLKYFTLCVIQASFSAFLTNAMADGLQWNEVLSKIIIDILLFFVSFQVQNRWVFGIKVSKN